MSGPPQRTSPNPNGRPPALTPQIHSAIVGAMHTGMTYERTAKVTGIGLRSISRWLARGQDAEHAARARIALTTPPTTPEPDEPDEPPINLADALTTHHSTPHDDPDSIPVTAEMIDARELRFWQLWRDVEAARSAWVQEALLKIREAGQGLDIERKRVVTRTRTVNGQRVTETETTIETETKVDWKAAAWALERMLPGEFSRRTVVEHTGADDGPIQIAVGEMRNLIRHDLVKLADDLSLPTPTIDGVLALTRGDVEFEDVDNDDEIDEADLMLDEADHP